MKILVLHSEVAPGAPPEEMDTLIAANAVRDALATRGHAVSQAAFAPDLEKLTLLTAGQDMVFNLVEGIDGKGALAPLAQHSLAVLGVPYTGTSGAAMAMTNDKPMTKRRLREAGLLTPDWSEGPDWAGLDDAGAWIVKSSLEDASLGLDDGCVVTGAEAVKARAADSAARHGGDWFAERFVDGREFNIAVLGPKGRPRIMPMAEMTFAAWPDDKPRIVGYDAKWAEGSVAERQTVRLFGVEEADPVLAAKIRHACETVWEIFDLSGFVRVDFRVDGAGNPLILEINANPCISPDGGFAAAAEQAGMRYDELIEEIVEAAR
jgi:D-alanine-D-alanine ligase